MERLQKVIAASGIASRRKAEEMIRQGRVKVNGQTVKEMGVKVSTQDRIEVDGHEINKEEKVYFLLNKPKRTICSVSDDKERDTVVDIIDCKERIFPVGRLDYEVAVKGVLTDGMCALLEKGIELEDGKTLPAEVFVLQRSEKKNKTVLQITIQEGRNRQVRRMMEFFNCEVTRLNRIQYAFLNLGNLRQGQYRKLRMFEVHKLMSIVNKNDQSLTDR